MRAILRCWVNFTSSPSLLTTSSLYMPKILQNCRFLHPPHVTQWFLLILWVLYKIVWTLAHPKGWAVVSKDKGKNFWYLWKPSSKRFVPVLLWAIKTFEQICRTSFGSCITPGIFWFSYTYDMTTSGTRSFQILQNLYRVLHLHLVSRHLPPLHAAHYPLVLIGLINMMQGWAEHETLQCLDFSSFSSLYFKNIDTEQSTRYWRILLYLLRA